MNHIPDIYMAGYSTEFCDGFRNDLVSPSPGFYFRTGEDCLTYMCDELMLDGHLREIPISHDRCRIFEAVNRWGTRPTTYYLYLWRNSPYLVKEAQL